ncbi:MAG: hypothetical protein UR27_C0014G0003 [Candidatus Peregrinibacteria bacterium GW2011_GWA2_33_10]|nr:MAG: hypothetical protein UR27_C0014G0003 [Candidatus Peregrinibacteria bacterium GW2011_GWA2_33_10]
MAAASYKSYYVEGYVYFKDSKGSMNKMSQSDFAKYKVSITSDKSSSPAFVLSDGKYKLTLKIYNNDAKKAYVYLNSDFFNDFSKQISLEQTTTSLNIFVQYAVPNVPTPTLPPVSTQPTVLITGYFYEMDSCSSFNRDQITQNSITLKAVYTNNISSGEAYATFNSKGMYTISIPTDGQYQSVSLVFSHKFYDDQTIIITVKGNKSQSLMIKKSTEMEYKI